MCGASAPPPPAPPPPPPQMAKTPSATEVQASTSTLNIAQGGVSPSTTLLTGPRGDAITTDKIAKKTLLGS